MNKQEIFDKVATHLITQGVQAKIITDHGTGHTSCVYRGPNGTMCAAGCLIPDDEYKPEFEGLPWLKLQDKIPSLASLPGSHHELISSLQGVHDCEYNWESIERLKNLLEGVAFMYGLSTDILN
jgi:hypothetical protein